MSNEKDMVGRKTEYDTLTEFITSKEKGVRILGINGLGGIGKTYLLDMVLKNTRPEKNSTIVFRLNGSKDESNYDFIGLFNFLVSSIHVPETFQNRDKVKDKLKTYLPKTQTAINQYNKMLDAISKEIDSNKDYSEERKIIMKRFIYISREVVNRLPKASLYSLLIQGVVNSDLLIDDKFISESMNLVSDILQTSSILPVMLQPYPPEIRTNLHGILSESMYLDLQNLYNSSNKSSPPLHDKILIIIDDFEIISKVFTTFLIESLIRKFREVPYSIRFVILGRDNLESFKQHLRDLIEIEIAVKSFSEEETLALLAQHNFSKSESEQIYKDSYGYPFLIASIIEDREEGVRYKQAFYTKITRWMSKTEKEWFDEICYLEIISHDTLKIIFPDFSPEQIKMVMEWFKNEASIRDPYTKKYMVNSFVRRKILDLFETELGPITYNKKVKSIQDRIKQQQTS